MLDWNKKRKGCANEPARTAALWSTDGWAGARERYDAVPTQASFLNRYDPIYKKKLKVKKLLLYRTKNATFVPILAMNWDLFSTTTLKFF